MTEAAEKAFQNLRERIAKDASIDPPVKAAILEDLSSSDPTQLTKLLAALTKIT